LLGDFSQTSTLINGLESDRRHVRYLCHEALRSQTGHDFGYDHRIENPVERSKAIEQWRDWWAEQSGDRMLRTAKQGNATVDFSIAQPPPPPRNVPGDREMRDRDPWSALHGAPNSGRPNETPIGAVPGGAAVMQGGPESKPASRRDSRPESRPESRRGR
jgi:hypothetical protein